MGKIQITENTLNKIIASSIRKVLKEDLFPNGIDCTPARTAWMGISNALTNIQQYMQTKQEEYNREHDIDNGTLKDITEEDVIELVDYIHLTLNNVLTSTFPNLKK